MGAELLDRSVKPPRLNSLGTRVLEQARDLLQRTETLKSLASRDAEPHGLLRIGLDVAAVLLPEGRTGPPPLLTNIIATDRVEIVQGTAGNVHGDWKSLGRAPWVLNPPGCLLRANLIDQMDRAGFTPHDCGDNSAPWRRPSGLLEYGIRHLFEAKAGPRRSCCSSSHVL